MVSAARPVSLARHQASIAEWPAPHDKDLFLAIQGQVVTLLGDQHLRAQPRGGNAFVRQMRRTSVRGGDCVGIDIRFGGSFCRQLVSARVFGFHFDVNAVATSGIVEQIRLLTIQLLAALTELRALDYPQPNQLFRFQRMIALTTSSRGCP